MRIAIWHNLASGGAKRALQYQIKGLVQQGHQVKVWTPPTSCQTFADVRDFAQEVVVPLRETRFIGGWRFKGRWESVRMYDRLAAMREHCQQCATQIRAEGYELLFAHSCMLFRATPIAGLCSLPSLIYQHEPYRPLYEAIPELPWPAPSLKIPTLWPPRELSGMLRDWDHTYAHRLQARAELDWIRQFSAIAVNSLFSRESMLRAYGLESQVLYLGIDTDAFTPGAEAKQPYVVGLGSITVAKGLERAIDAVATIPQEKRPHLIWIGNVNDPGYQQQMQERAQRCAVVLSTRLMLDDAQVVKIISEAACMIYTPKLEPFGFAPLEACACGTAVVAVAEGGVRETIIDGINGRLISSFDATTLGKAISSFTGDLEMATSVGKMARKNVEANWKWETANSRLESALKALKKN